MRSDDKTRALDALAGTDSPLEPEFEQYLNAAEADPAKLKAYLASYDKVIALLLQRKARRRLPDCFSRWLPTRGMPAISRQLANHVQSVWNADAYTQNVPRGQREAQTAGETVRLERRSARSSHFHQQIRRKSLQTQIFDLKYRAPREINPQ